MRKSGSNSALGLVGMGAVGEPALERYRHYVVEHLGDAGGYFGHLKLAHAGRVHKPAAALGTAAEAMHLADRRRVQAFAVTLADGLRRDAIGPLQRVDERRFADTR